MASFNDEANEVLLFIDILKYPPATSDELPGAPLPLAISYSTDYFTKLLKGEIKLPAGSRVNIAELKKTLDPTLGCMNRAVSLAKEAKKLATELEEKQKNILASATPTPPSSQNQPSFFQSTTFSSLNKKKTKKSKPSPVQLTAEAVKIQKLQNEALNKLSTQALRDFNGQNRVLIPVSSENENGPNAQMICEFRKSDKGEILFLVWNLGFGAKENLSKDTIENDIQHAPVRVFRCANDKHLDKDNLKQFIEQCISLGLPDFAGKAKVDSKEYYKYLISQLSFLGGVEIESAPFYQKAITPQEQGSSPWKVVEAFVQNTSIKKENADEIQYEILKHTFETLLKKHSDKIAQSHEAQLQIAEMANLFALKLQEVATAEQFTVERQKAGLDLIVKAKQLVAAKPARQPIETQRQSQFRRLLATDHPIDIRGNGKWHHFHPHSHASLDTPDSTDFKIEPTKVVKNLDEAHSAMEKMLQATHAKNNSSIKDIKQFENFLKSLPLSDEFINQPHNVKLHDFTLTLHKFVNKYINLCGKKRGLPFGERQIAIYSAVAMFELLANKHFSARENILTNLYSHSSDGPGFEQLMQQLPTMSHPVLKYFDLLPEDDKESLPERHKLLEYSLRSHYFTDTDPATQERLSVIKEIFKRKPSALKDYNLIALDIIASEDIALKQAAGVTGKSDNDKRKVGKYFRNACESLKSQHPNTYQDASFCMAYKRLVSGVSDYISGSGGFYSSSIITTHKDLIESAHYSTDLQNKKIYSSDGYYPYYSSNRIEESHPIANEKLVDDLRINIAERKRIDKITPNNIQIKLHAKSIDKKLDLRRMLSQIGAVPGSQIVCAIEFLQSNATNLEQRDVQNVLFMLLFDKALIANEIKENPSAILKLLDIMESGLKYYSHDELKQPLAFYCQINTFLRKVLATSPKNTPQFNDILAKTEELCQLHNNYQNTLTKTRKKSELQSGLQKDLEALSVIELNNQLTLHGKLNAAQLKQFYTLNFNLRFAKELVEQPFLNKEVDFALFTLKAYALANPSLTTESVLLDVVKTLDVPFDQKHFKFTYPHVTSGETKIDLINAKIISNKSKFMPLPKEVYQNDQFKEMFGNDDILSSSLGEDQYEFQYKGENYKLVSHQYYYQTEPTLQKNIAIRNGALKWYQLTSPEDSNLKYQFPSSLINDKNWIWSSQDGDVIIVDKKTNLIKMTCEKADRTAYLLDQDGNRVRKLLPKTVIERSHNELDFLREFESPEFIEISEDLQTRNIHIHLTRYNLSFTSKLINGVQYFINDDDHETCLTKSNQSPIEFYDKALVLASIPHANQPQKPVKTILAKDFGTQQTSSNAANVNQPMTKQYATYYHAGLDVEPASAADAFYLAFLYQNSGNDQSSYKILADYSHRFLGSANELKSLLALAAGGKKQTPQAHANKVLCCYTIVQYLRQGHTLKGLIERVKKQDAGNEKLNESVLEALEKFTPLAKQILVQYLVLKDFVPKDMRLDRREELALIDFVKQDQPNFYLDIQNKKRKLKNLLKEYNGLTKINGQKSESVKRRIVALKEKMLKEYHFVPKAEKLVPQVYDLTKRDSSQVNHRHQYRPAGTPITHSTITIDDLTAQTTSSEVGNSYLALFHEAASDPAKEAKLHAFLNAKLIACIHKNRPAKGSQQAFKLSDQELEDSGLPEPIQNLIKNLDGIKLPDLFSLPAEDGAYALLKSMISNKAKVQDVINKIERGGRNGYTKITNGIMDTAYYGDVDGAIAFALSHQSIQFHVPKATNENGNKVSIRFMPNIAERKYADDKTSNTSTLKSLDALLTSLNLNDRLANNTTSSKTKESEKVFSGNAKNKDPFYGSLIDESNKDYQKGRNDNFIQTEIQQQWYKELSVPTRNRLKYSIEAVVNGHHDNHKKLSDNILKLLNQGPKDPKAQIQWQLALHAKTRKEFTMEDAFKAFDKGCLTTLKSKYHLDDADAKKLLQLTSQYLVEGTQAQQYQRTLAILEKMEDPGLSANNLNTLVKLLGTELTLRRCYDINKHPSILLFEYLDNKMVYPKQISMLDKLLKQKGDGGYESVAIQLIMGGGKSKVLLPLLAKMRANGTNLTIIEVPSALLETNFYDLHAVSSKLNQNAHLLKFDRNIDADSNYFYRMREHLRSVIANKEYLVTTRESIQSIELKYIDVLTNPMDDLVEWEKQIKYLDDIVNLIKQQGDAILDEIDLNLRTRDQLIYTVGEGKPAPKFIIESIVAMYKSFAHVNHTINGSKVNLHDVITLKCEKPSDEHLQVMLEMLMKHLVNSKQSPIAAMLAKLQANQLKEIENFLTNQFSRVPECIKAMSLRDQSILAVYKEHINRLLPVSLSRKLHENFGLTQDPLKLGMQKEIAIPYLSNNVPNESAKFQNHLVTMNYTIQTHMAQSLSVEVMEAMLKDFKARLSAEKNLNAYAAKPSHLVEAKFKAMFGEAVDLNLLDINDSKKINAIHAQFKDSLAIKEHCLTEYILPAVLTNPLTICSNDQNHVSAYRSTVGFTGTDYNYRCFHDSIKRDNTESFGTDGQTISHLINKERQTHVLNQNNSTVLFDLLESHKSLNDVRAIIDVGAQFKGVSNRDVANRLAQFYFNHPAPGIKNILYFNKDNVLCALKVSEHPEHEEPLVLGSSDNIAGKLDCEPHEYFTYYDQAHTTGTDIKQAANTIGIVTVSEKSMLRDVLQAVMRLRDLKDSHHVEFAVMQSLVKDQPSINKWDVKTILNVCLQYQAKTLMQEHLSAAFNKINNIVRQNVLGQIRSASSIMDKVILSDAYKQMLYQFDNASYFDKYGVPETMIETESLLKIAQDKAMEIWKSCLENAQKKADSQELTTITDEMKKVIAKSVKICAQKQLSPLNNNCENQVISQIEVQNERQNETEVESQVQDAKLKERKYKSWAKVDLNKYKPGNTVSLMSMESIANAHRVPRNWKFDSELQVSENFYNTCSRESADKLNRFKKPLFYIMTLRVGNQLTKILITQQEADELRNKLKQGNLANDRQIWIETPSGIPYAGKQPAKKDLHPKEDRLREQIQFYNADIVYLAANYGSLSWFKEDAEAKFNYLQNELLILHPNKGASLSLLKEMMLQDGKLKPAVIAEDANLLTDKSWQRLRDAYLYPSDNKQPAHTKAEYARLASYANNRDKVRFFHLRSKWQEFKKSVASFFTRCKKALFIKGVNFALENFKASTFDYLQSKRWKLGLYGLLSSLVQIAMGVSWFFGLGLGTHLFLGSLIVGSVIVARNLWCAYAKTKYDSITKIENITNSSELYALQTGVESGNTYVVGFLKSLVRPSAYFYPKAYYAGLEIGSAANQGVLGDEIKRKTIST
jgi:hypothetical protein